LVLEIGWGREDSTRASPGIESSWPSPLGRATRDSAPRRLLYLPSDPESSVPPFHKGIVACSSTITSQILLAGEALRNSSASWKPSLSMTNCFQAGSNIA